MVNVGLVGVTGWGKNHLQVLSEIDQAKVVALCDKYRDRLEYASNELDNCPKIFTCYEDFIEQPDMDAVFITVPNYLHCEFTIAALRNDKDVFLEKPIAVNKKEINQLEEVCMKSRKFIQVGFEYRYSKYFQELKALVAEKLQNVRAISIMELRSDWRNLELDKGKTELNELEDRSKGYWRHSKSRSGGLLVEKCCHHFDLMNWFSDSSMSGVKGTGGNDVFPARETMDHANVVMECKNGVEAFLQIYLARGGNSKDEVSADLRLEIIGDRNKLVGKMPKKEILLYDNLGASEPIEKLNVDERTMGHIGVRRENLAFIKTVNRRERPKIGFAEGKGALLEALAAQNAIERGAPVGL